MVCPALERATEEESGTTLYLSHTHTHKLKKHSFWFTPAPLHSVHEGQIVVGRDYVSALRKSPLPLILGIDMWLALAREDDNKHDAKKTYKMLCLATYVSYVLGDAVV